MSNHSELFAQILLRCRNSPSFFIENFCKVKHPKAGIIPFKLFSYQNKSLSAFRSNRFNCYKKTRQCLAKGSRIWTPKGPIEIQNIKPGQKIYSLNLCTGLLEITKVAKVYDNGIAKCKEVRTKSGHKSICTYDHKYLTPDGWKSASDLELKDRLIQIRDNQYWGKIVSKSEAILLGYLLTDGFCGRKAHHFTNTNWKYLLEFQKHYSILFNKKLKISIHRNSGFGVKKAFRLYSYCKECRNWLSRLGILGLTKKYKYIPDEVFSWDNESIAILINRMFSSDGWYSAGGCNELGIGQISVRILYQLKQLLSRFHIDCNVSEKNNPIPKLRIYGGPDFERFFKYIDIFGKKPRMKITKEFLFNRARGTIKSIRSVGKRHVYDLEVPPHHNYIADGVVVHNCGISTLAGAFALWYAMFYNHKTILIVSKGDRDAVAFLDKNMKFVYKHLPDEFIQTYGKLSNISNEHSIKFPNGSSIVSLPSGPDVLRSNSSSLNIIDEAAFMRDMDSMWSAGFSTLSQGGSVIIISTTFGQGNWYHITWVDAMAKRNQFNPIEINWWDMDWKISYVDEFTHQTRDICPIKDLRKCESKEEIDKYGPYWSPWLEEQYIGLQQRGESEKFRQEILAEFVGTGDTVLPREYLTNIGNNTRNKCQMINKVDYIHPVSDEKLILDFEDKLWIWNKPVKPSPPIVEHGKIIKPGVDGHVYSVGVDIASGEGDDYSAVNVFDHTTREQAAELNLKVLPSILAMMVDYIARWYNMALVVPERTGLGAPVTQSIYYDLGYPNLYRMRSVDGKMGKKVGFPTTPVYKPMLIKALLDNLGPEDGYKIYSSRLYEQLSIFVHLGNNRTGSVKGPGNHDDLSISAALALVGATEAMVGNVTNLYPAKNIPLNDVRTPPMSDSELRSMVSLGGLECMMPVSLPPSEINQTSINEEYLKFQKQLGGITPNSVGGPTVIPRKNLIQFPRSAK